MSRRCHSYRRTGLLPILLKKTRFAKIEEKPDRPDRHVDSRERNMNEWIIMRRNEKRTNEDFSIGNVAIVGKRITKTNGRSPLVKNPDFSYRARLRAQENT